MAMTAAVKDELSRVTISKVAARRAEIATLLRFAGALPLVARHIVIEAELDTGSVARRLRNEIAEVRGADRAVMRDSDASGVLLSRLGAHEAVMAWEERRMRREVRSAANRLAHFDDANLRRSARAAVAAGARVERAMDILGADAPEHLVMAGRLRGAHPQASPEGLGQLAHPPLTQDAIARRIRPPPALAGRRATGP